MWNITLNYFIASQSIDVSVKLFTNHDFFERNNHKVDYLSRESNLHTATCHGYDVLLLSVSKQNVEK